MLCFEKYYDILLSVVVNVPTCATGTYFLRVWPSVISCCLLYCLHLYKFILHVIWTNKQMHTQIRSRKQNEMFNVPGSLYKTTILWTYVEALQIIRTRIHSSLQQAMRFCTHRFHNLILLQYIKKYTRCVQKSTKSPAIIQSTALVKSTFVTVFVHKLFCMNCISMLLSTTHLRCVSLLSATTTLL